MRIHRLLLSALVVAAPLAFGQKIAESLEVTVVEVPVTVHERGVAVRGLTKENFELLVDGKPVPVDYFEVVDLAKITDVRAPVPAAAYRNFLLLFDVANAAPGTIQRAKDAAKAFVETQIDARDLAAVGSYTTQNGASMLTSFTRDKSLLLAAIANLGDARHFKIMDPLRIALPAEPFRIQSLPAGPGDARGANLEAAARETIERNVKGDVFHAREALERINTQLDSFGAVAAALDRLRGQKQVILLSEGFDAGLVTGRTDLASESARNENARVERGEIWNVDSDQRFGGAREAQSVNVMADLFRRSDVRLHAIDIKGLRSANTTQDGLAKSSNEGLFLVTRPTGGTVFQNANDLSAQFDLLRQQEVIYLLGFKPRDRQAGKFHPLRVKLRGAKGELTHRAGYTDKDPSMNELEATLRLSELMTTGIEVRDLPMTLTVLPVPGEGDDARVPVVVEAAGAQLLEGVDSARANANLFVYAFDPNGQVADFQQQRITLDLARAGDAVRATGIRYLGSLLLKPGRYVVKALMRVDETGRIGLITTDVVVPAFGETAVLAPVAMREIGQWVTVISPGTGAEAADVLTLGERRFVPGVRVDVAAGAEPEIALLLRGIATENLAVTPTLIGADGSTSPVSLQLAGRAEPDMHGVAKLLFRMPAQNLAAGEYQLRFVVTPQGSAATTVTVPMVVR
ncbi:MAG TPA: VWA domain-containing protein [Thermoanaerobaculia bacterium]|jgi:VWFA-related protein